MNVLVSVPWTMHRHLIRVVHFSLGLRVLVSVVNAFAYNALAVVSLGLGCILQRRSTGGRSNYKLHAVLSLPPGTGKNARLWFGLCVE